jgi:hypothetical protein
VHLREHGCFSLSLSSCSGRRKISALGSSFQRDKNENPLGQLPEGVAIRWEIRLYLGGASGNCTHDRELAPDDAGERSSVDCEDTNLMTESEHTPSQRTSQRGQTRL